MIRKASGYDPILFRIDRRGATQAQDVFQHPGAREKLRVAAWRRHHLQADRQTRGGEPARQRQRRATGEGDRIDDAEPLDIIVECLAGAFADIAVLDREWRNDRRGR